MGSDKGRTRGAVGRTDGASLARFDFDRDNRIGASDVLIARLNQRRSLPLFSAPGAEPAAATTRDQGGTTPGAVITGRLSRTPPERGVLETSDPATLA